MVSKLCVEKKKKKQPSRATGEEVGCAPSGCVYFSSFSIIPQRQGKVGQSVQGGKTDSFALKYVN